MKKIVAEIKKHMKIYGVFAKNCMVAQMEYRFNFFMGIILESGWLFAKLLYVMVIFNTGVEIEGLPPSAMLLFIGTYIFMTGIYWSFFAINFAKISEYVRTGSLDLMITKPISLMFLVSMRYMDLGMPLPDIIAGIVMICMGWGQMAIPVTFATVGGFALFIVSGIVVSYALFLIPQLLSFWVVRTQAINEISYQLWDFNNMPRVIYNNVIKGIGTFLIPIFLITNFSTLFVLGRLETIEIIWGIVAPILLMIALRKLWKVALRNYTSANG